LPSDDTEKQPKTEPSRRNIPKPKLGNEGIGMADTPHTGRRSTLTCWDRALAYALAWLPPLGVMVWFLPRLAVLFRKLEEKGELPEPAHWTLAFVRFDQACYHLPAAITFVSAVVAAETLLGLTRRTRWERLGIPAWWLWIIGVGLDAWCLALAPLLLPVFKMG
jgi:hypothetical protein